MVAIVAIILYCTVFFKIGQVELCKLEGRKEREIKNCVITFYRGEIYIIIPVMIVLDTRVEGISVVKVTVLVLC